MKKNKILGIDTNLLLVGAAAYFLFLRPKSSGESLGVGGGGGGLLGSIGSGGPIFDLSSLTGSGDPNLPLLNEEQKYANLFSEQEALKQQYGITEQNATGLISALLQKLPGGYLGVIDPATGKVVATDPLNAIKTGGGLFVDPTTGKYKFGSGGFVSLVPSGQTYAKSGIPISYGSQKPGEIIPASFEDPNVLAKMDDMTKMCTYTKPDGTCG